MIEPQYTWELSEPMSLPTESIEYYKEQVNILTEKVRDLEECRGDLFDQLEIRLYEEYNKKIADTRDWLITQLDEFLATKDQEYQKYMADQKVTGTEVMAECLAKPCECEF